MQLPRRVELLRGMLGADLVGFQREQAGHNLAQLAQKLLGADAADATITVDGRTVRTGAFPVSIDVAEMRALPRPTDVVRSQARSCGTTWASPNGSCSASIGWITPRASSTG